MISNKYINLFNFGNYIPFAFTHLLAQLAFQSVFGHLFVYPPDVLFLDEDWPVEKLLDIQICSNDNKTIENPLELSISNTKSLNNEREIVNKLPFEVFRLNESCSGLLLNEALDVIPSNIPQISVSQNELNQNYPNSASSNSYSLLFEDLNNKDRATLQIEVVDVNDNAPRFLGGPYPLELIIPADSSPGYLLRRLEIIDVDQGIGGISRFSLKSDDDDDQNKINSLFSLNSPQCQWPKCSVELRLKQSMSEGERATIKVLARDGAGITRKRANKAEIKINVLAVADINLNKNEENENEEKEEEEDFNEYDENQMNGIFFNSNFRNNISDQNITTNIETTTKGFTVPLITFVKRRNNNESKLRSTTIETTTKDNENIIPKIYNVDSLSEDSPIGLELLHIPLPPLNKTSSIQFIQLDGSNSLKMLPNGSIQISQPLNFEITPILKAEIKLNKENNLLAKINNQDLPALLAIIADGPSVIYSIDQNFKDGNKFSINSTNGKLYYKEYLNNKYLNSFDYERQNIYLILINICSKEKCQQLFLEIKVLDLNDNCPKFNFLKEENKLFEWNIDIKEDENLNKNIPINQFPEAVDLDGSEEQRSKCYKLVENRQETFGILIPERPEIYLIKGLDRELIPSYQLKIIVEDCPNISQKCTENISKEDNSSHSFIYLNINIIDINDNSPQFLIKHFFAAIIDLNRKEPFLQLKAEDLDVGDKNNLRYSWGEGMIQTFEEPISMADIPFTLNRSTGELSIKEDFDFTKTTIKSYTFRVRVNDPLPAQHEDQATVTVTLLNPDEHLLELYLFRNNDDVDLDLAQLERMLSSIVQNNENITNNLIKYIPIYRLFQCGRENCTILNIYFLDNLLQPINAYIGLEIIKNIFKLNKTINELKEKFGIIGFEEKVKINK
uniref:Cadherin domain-containing protein n=1 Tax=Meloidogyne hapla TaxID=6305 RepID=A0A1I8C329_MELHA